MDIDFGKTASDYAQHRAGLRFELPAARGAHSEPLEAVDVERRWRLKR